MSAAQQELQSYRRLWIFVTATTVLGLGLTVTLNVMHAPDTIGARIIGGTPPIFVLLCLELISRIPATSRLLAGFRIAASAVVTGLSFAISYEQQREFVMALGFDGWVAYAFPVIIDGAMVVSTLSLVEVTRKVRALRVIVAAETAPAPVLRAVDPALRAREEQAQSYREAAANLRRESTVAALNGKPFVVTEAAAA